MKRTLLAVFTPALIALGSIPGISFAQAAPEAQAETRQECDIEDSLSAFLAIKDQASGRVTVQPTEEFRLEKALLQKVIACMESETDAMVTTLSDLKDIEHELAEIRDGFLATLANYRERLAGDTRRLREIPELKDVKLFAKNLLDWREKEYRPALQSMLALSYIVHGRESLKTASARLHKINAALRTLGLGGNRELRILLDKAAKQIRGADALNNKARDLFFAVMAPQPEPAEDDGAATSTAALAELTPLAGATSTPAEPAKQPEPAPDPKEVAKEALLKIKDAYRLFVNASEAVGRLLN